MVDKIKVVKYILVLIPLISIAFPLWTLNIHPAFMGRRWLVINVYGYGHVEGPIDSLNIANHYVGLKDIVPEKLLELKIIPLIYPTMAILMYLFLFGDEDKSSKAKYLIIAMFIGVVLYFQLWLYRYGHDIDPKLARVEVGSFTPYVVGYYKIANMTVLAYFDVGFFLMLGAFIVAWYVRRKFG